ncbi:putative cyclic di-GMP phosphodiesterase VC_1348 [Gammaproteobacteria bacterium]
MIPMQTDFLEASPYSQTEERSTILIVDDTPENLSVLGEILQPYYHVKVASSGSRALSVASATPSPDLILLDVMMPGLDGYMVLERLQAQEDTRKIPVLFVTALDAGEDEERGLTLGAVDYITKPIRPAVVLARVRTHLRLKQASDFLQNQNDFLESEIIRRMRDNQLIQNVSIHALANLAEARDAETGNHIRRTQKYVTVLARKLREHPKYSYRLTPRFIELISRATPLHDIGKVGIPDLVLRKNGRLTLEEFEVMKQHTKIGAEAIDQAMRAACTDQEYQALRVYSSIGLEEVLAEGEREKPLAFLELAKEIAHYHHERWDGTGYPMGLKGQEIPLPARLMAIADVFDGIVSHHVYKQRVSIEESVQLIINGRGSYFDPDLVDAFLGVVEDFRSIAMYYADEQAAQL